MSDDLDFTAEEFSNLTVSERIKRCRRVAQSFRQLVERSYTDAYLRMAREWERLADHIEQNR